MITVIVKSVKFALLWTKIASIIIVALACRHNSWSQSWMGSLRVAKIPLWYTFFWGAFRKFSPNTSRQPPKMMIESFFLLPYNHQKRAAIFWIYFSCKNKLWKNKFTLWKSLINRKNQLNFTYTPSNGYFNFSLYFVRIEKKIWNIRSAITKLKALFYFLDHPEKGEIKICRGASFACLGASTLVRIIAALLALLLLVAAVEPVIL